MASPTDTVGFQNAPAVAQTEKRATEVEQIASDTREIQVADDLPRPLPVMAKEADVVEMYLASLLDELLGKNRAFASRTSSIT